jgi:hypothetical protein
LKVLGCVHFWEKRRWILFRLRDTAASWADTSDSGLGSWVCHRGDAGPQDSYFCEPRFPPF